MDLHQNFDDPHLIICRDLNARTGKEHYSRNESNVCDNESDGNNDLTLDRNSEDRDFNMCGRQLLEVCKMLECVILNGLCQMGFDDSCTYIFSSG